MRRAGDQTARLKLTQLCINSPNFGLLLILVTDLKIHRKREGINRWKQKQFTIE